MRQVEATLKQREHSEERVARLETIPGVGRVSALTLVAAVEKIARFAEAKQLTAYNGIVPTVRSSGEREQQESITRQGRSEVRAVWVQAAHSLVPGLPGTTNAASSQCTDGCLDNDIKKG